VNVLQFPPKASRHVAEFVGCFAPSLPPDGWDKVMAEIDNWPTPIDRFADMVTGFLENMPDATSCEGGLLASIMGYSRQACENKAFICDLDSEMWLCKDCWNEYQQGDWRS
jgi:hypothetical protein